jgi:hypothetical protein
MMKGIISAAILSIHSSSSSEAEKEIVNEKKFDIFLRFLNKNHKTKDKIIF